MVQSIPDRRSQSLRLNQGMSEAEVFEILGQPAKSELLTCGQALGKPWACKTWTYSGSPERLKVRFAQTDKGWFVNHWSFSLLP